MNAFTGSSAGATAGVNPADGLGKDLLMTLENPGAGVPMLLTLSTGAVSPMVPLSNGGAFLRVAKREAPSVADDSPEVKSMMQEIGSREAGESANLVLGNLVEDAAKKLQPAASTPPAPKS